MREACTGKAAFCKTIFVTPPTEATEAVGEEGNGPSERSLIVAVGAFSLYAFYLVEIIKT